MGWFLLVLAVGLVASLAGSPGTYEPSTEGEDREDFDNWRHRTGHF